MNNNTVTELSLLEFIGSSDFFYLKEIYKNFYPVSKKSISYIINKLVNKNILNIQEDKISIVLSEDKYTGTVCLENKNTVIKSKDSTYFLPINDTQYLFVNDTVTFKINPKTNIAKVIEIKSRAFNTIWGYCKKELDGYVLKIIGKNYGNVSCMTLLSNSHEHINNIVQAQIISYPNNKSMGVCSIIQSVSKINSKLAIDIASSEYRLSREHSLQSIKQAKSISFTRDGKSYTDIDFITIDDATTHDLDDAVFAQEYQGLYNLKVAIADVSHYVHKKTPLDIQALQKGNSYYFPNDVFHMLPSYLSQDICALKPNQERRALICDMNICDKGNIVSYKFYDGIIKSRIKATFDQVDLFFDKEISMPENISNSLTTLGKIRNILLKKRQALNCFSFNTCEPKIILNNSCVKDVLYFDNTFSRSLIEETMVAANICAAKLLSCKRKFGVFRVHEKPIRNDIKNIMQEAINANIIDKPISLDKFLSIARNNLLAANIILRNTNKAIYKNVNQGHFGLAVEYYTHFTSPIRRYSDLVVHRIIKSILNNKSDNYKEKELNSICEHVSNTGRLADKSNWRCNDILINNFIYEQKDAFLIGIVTSILYTSAYVFLLKYGQEGSIKIDNIKLCIGDKVMVSVYKLSQEFKLYLNLIRIV